MAFTDFFYFILLPSMGVPFLLPFFFSVLFLSFCLLPPSLCLSRRAGNVLSACLFHLSSFLMYLSLSLSLLHTTHTFYNDSTESSKSIICSLGVGLVMSDPISTHHHTNKHSAQTILHQKIIFADCLNFALRHFRATNILQFFFTIN